MKNAGTENRVNQQDSSKALISKHFYKKAKKKFVRFGLERFEGIYFKEVFTYTEKEFADDFLAVLESQ